MENHYLCTNTFIMLPFKAIRYITPAKIWNLCRLHIFYSKAKRKNFNTKVPAPYFASYEPTNICNLSCEMCPSGKGLLKRTRGMADMPTFKKVIDENQRTLATLILHFQGEPLMCKQLGDMISYARQHKIYTMFSTNGQLLAENIDTIRNARPDHIIISLDGLSDETYTKYRVGGNVQKVYDGLEKLSQLTSCERPYTELQFLVFSYNEHEIKALKSLKKKYRIDKITLKSAQIYENSQTDFLPENPKYSRYQLDADGNFHIKHSQKNRCRRIIFGSVICYDGRVVPCCFDKDADHEFGNVKENTLMDIRNSKKFNDFLTQLFTNRKGIKICSNCTE